MKIAKEGFGVIATVGVLGVISFFSHLKFMGWVFFILFLFCLYFFRDPERFPPKIENFIVSPADGKVLKVEEVEDSTLKELCYKISIFMSVFDVHINRAPFEGKVVDKVYKKGKFFNASLDKASEENERMEYVVECKNFSYRFVQIAGLIARRIVSYVEPGDEISTSQKVGMIKFGSRAEIIIPKRVVKINITTGQQVYAGETVIGVLVK